MDVCKNSGNIVDCGNGKKKEWGGWGMIMRNERWQVEEESEHMAVSVTDAMRP